MWSRKNLKSRIPLCSPCDSRIPTPQKHEIPLPLVTVIPTSRPCFQIKSRISRQKNAKSRIPPNLLGTLSLYASTTCMMTHRWRVVTRDRDKTSRYNLNYDSYQPLFYEIAKIERCVEYASIATCEYALIYTFRS